MSVSDKQPKNEKRRPSLDLHKLTPLHLIACASQPIQLRRALFRKQPCKAVTPSSFASEGSLFSPTNDPGQHHARHARRDVEPPAQSSRCHGHTQTKRRRKQTHSRSRNI